MDVYLFRVDFVFWSDERMKGGVFGLVFEERMIRDMEMRKESC